MDAQQLGPAQEEALGLEVSGRAPGWEAGALMRGCRTAFPPGGGLTLGWGSPPGLPGSGLMAELGDSAAGAHTPALK